MAYAPTLTPKLDFAPVPRVEIVFSSVHPNTERATVYRIAGGRTFRVRGGINVPAAGGFTVQPDAEAPLQTSLTYRAEMFDGDGSSLGFTDSTSTLLAYDGTIIHQPLDPARNVVAGILAGTAEDLYRPFRGDELYPQGRTSAVWIGSGRSGLTGVAIVAHTGTIEAEQQLQSVFGLYDDNQIPIICLRTTLKLGLPMPFFGLVKEPHRKAINARIGRDDVRWDMTANEAAPPAQAIVTALLTYGDFEATYATYSAFETAYLTYLAAESDYSIAGAV